jgi:two-component system response regulator RegA
MTRSPLSVCVVEDEPRFRDLLVREISAMGFGVRGFRSAEDAWPALERDGFDAAFIDLNLPGQDGMGLFQRIHDDRPNMAVVILTGFGTLATAVQALRWGALDYLTKPCNLDQIEGVLARVEQNRRKAGVAREARITIDVEEGENAHAAAERTLEAAERELILTTLGKYGGRKADAARSLGISLRTLYNKLHTYRLQGFVE